MGCVFFQFSNYGCCQCLWSFPWCARNNYHTHTYIHTYTHTHTHTHTCTRTYTHTFTHIPTFIYLVNTECCSFFPTTTGTATSFDGFYAVPGTAPDATFYARPVSVASGDGVALTFPAAFCRVVLFGITAYNPRGMSRDLATNVAANALLRAELDALVPSPQFIAGSFGFSHDWREDGFTCAFAPDHAAEGQAAFVRLAEKYDQGAIYKYTPLVDAGTEQRPCALMRRETVPVVMSTDVGADVVVQACDPPPWSRASRTWSPAAAPTCSVAALAAGP
jgi:hypothetical protein